MYIPQIRPITDLKKTSEIAALCHQTGEPVFITKNGYSDLVIMSVESYGRHIFLSEVAGKLAEAEEELRAGAKGSLHADVMARQRAKLHGKV